MTIPKLQPAIRLIFATVLLTFIALSCNDSSSDMKEDKKDTISVSTPAVPDTMAMDTASTRPIKTTN